MPRKRVRRKIPEWVLRTVRISSINPHVSIHASKPRGEEPSIESGPSLELTGTMDESIRDSSTVEIHVYPKDKVEPRPAKPPSVGAIIAIRPVVSVVVSFPQQDFDRVWQFALSGGLKYASFVATPPHYKTAHVINLSFSSEAEE